MNHYPVPVQSVRGVPLFIRPLTADDLQSVQSLEFAAHTHPWSEALLERGLQRYQCWGIQSTQEGRAPLLGFAIVSQVLNEAELLDFVVSPECQGQGIGGCLLAWVIQQLRGQASRFYLEVRQSNAAAIGLYDAQGFIEVGVRPNYYPSHNGREDALLMAMELLE